MALTAGMRLGRYEIVGAIGAGGMGAGPARSTMTTAIAAIQSAFSTVTADKRKGCFPAGDADWELAGVCLEAAVARTR